MANLTKVTSPSGVRVTVNSQYADRFTNFMSDLEGTGYKLRQSDTGGYNYRYIAGTNTLSRHATGDAVDINWNANPQIGSSNWKSDLPSDVGDIAARNGLRWGGTFKNPDPMHFEADKNWDGSKEATERLRQKNFKDGKSSNSERGGEGKTNEADKREGEGDGNKDTKESNSARDKENKPPKPTKHNDIKGTTNNYQRTQTPSIASRLPTHEPWHGHPKTTEGARMGLQESGGGGGGGTGSGQGGPSTGQGAGQSQPSSGGGGTGSGNGSGGGSSSGGGGSSSGGGGSSSGGSDSVRSGTSTSPSRDTGLGLRGSVSDGGTSSSGGGGGSTGGRVGDASTNTLPSSSVNYGRDVSNLGVQDFQRFQNNDSVKGFIFHHTGGRGSPEGVQSTLNGGRNMSLGVQFIIDRDGTVHKALPDNSTGGHMKNGTGDLGAGLSNRNTIGVEMIAKNNGDLTQAQIESARSLYAEQAEKYPNLAPYGHGEVNGHKQKDEGMGAVDAIRKDLKKKGRKPKTADPGLNKDEDDKKPQPSDGKQPEDADNKSEKGGTSAAPEKAADVPMSARTLQGYKKSFEGTRVTPDSSGSAAP